MHSTTYAIISAVLLAAAAGYGIYYGVKLYWHRRYATPQVSIQLVRGDITTQEVDAIVNAAKRSLLGGGGVDGAIHRAAGPNLLATCKKIREEELPDGLDTGQAVATGAFRLPAKYVIHAVGPVYDDCDPQDTHRLRGLLRDCYTNSLKVADELGARSIAFPLISSGVYGWPTQDAIVQALTAIRTARTDVREVRLVLFDEQTLELAKDAAREMI